MRTLKRFDFNLLAIGNSRCEHYIQKRQPFLSFPFALSVQPAQMMTQYNSNDCMTDNFLFYSIPEHGRT